MGYFNFFYKLSMILSNKKRFKIFIVIGLICLFIFACSRGVFAAVTPEDTNALMNYQLQMQKSMIDYVKFMYQTNVTGFNKTDADKLLESLLYNYCWVEPSNSSYGIFNVFIYSPNTGANNMVNFNTEGTWSIDVDEGTQYPCMLSNITIKHMYTIYNVWNVNNPTPKRYDISTSYLIPEGFFLVRSNAINDFLAEKGKFSTLTPTYATSDEELQAITRSGFQDLNSNIQQQTQQMTNTINNASTSITNSVDNLNNTITDTTTDDSQVELAQDNNQDLTNGFFTGLYNSIEDAFTDTSYKYINFPIPFTNKNITFSSSYVLNNIKRNSKFSVLVSLAESVWWFGLGYFVLLDIYKKINAIKSGDLTNIENENITTNLL